MRNEIYQKLFWILQWDICLNTEKSGQWEKELEMSKEKGTHGFWIINSHLS